MARIDPNTRLDGVAPTKSNFMKKEDVGRAGRILTIKDIEKEMIKTTDGEEEEKALLIFVEPDAKPMVLNKTNAEMVSLCTGAQTVAEARGKRVRVYEDPTIMFGGKRVGGLRIGDAQYAAPQPGRAAVAPDLGDDRADDSDPNWDKRDAPPF